MHVCMHAGMPACLHVRSKVVLITLSILERLIVTLLFFKQMKTLMLRRRGEDLWWMKTLNCSFSIEL